MSISLAFSPQVVANSVLVVPDTDSKVLKVSSRLVNGVAGPVLVGTFTATTPAAGVVWGLSSSAPSWVKLNTNGKTASLQVDYNNQGVIPLTLPHDEPILFHVEVKEDGSTVPTVYPVAIIVREPLIVKATGETSRSVLAHDETVAPIQFKAYAYDGTTPLSDCSYFAPDSVVPGKLEFFVDEDNTAYYQLVPSTSLDDYGISSVGSQVFTLKVAAYKAGTMYDSPRQASVCEFPLTVTGTKVGTPFIEVGAHWDQTAAKLSAWSITGVRAGESKAFKVSWTVVTGPGTLAAEDRTNGTCTVTPTGVGNVTLRATLLNADGTAVTPAVTKDLIIAVTNVGSDNKVYATVLPTQKYWQVRGKKVYVRVHLPAITSDATITPEVVSSGSHLPTDLTGAFTITSTSKYGVVSFTVPTNSDRHETWLLKLSVEGQLVAAVPVVCAGLPWLEVGFSASTLSGQTGEAITAIPLQVQEWVQGTPVNFETNSAFFTVGLNSNNASKQAYVGAAVRQSSLPIGLRVSVADGVSGVPLTSASASAHFIATRDGFSPAKSLGLGLAVTEYVTSLTVSRFTSSHDRVTGSTQFSLSWGINGSGLSHTIVYQDDQVRQVTGTTISLSGLSKNSIFLLKLDNPLGVYYSAPILVTYDSSASLAKLPPSPTIGTINEQNVLELAWTPVQVNGGYDNYKEWTIQLLNGADPTPVAITRTDGQPITGLDMAGTSSESRRFSFPVSAGDHAVSMQAIATADSYGNKAVLDSDPWDQYRSFPVLGSASISKSTLLKKEPFTVSIGDGFTADRWRIRFDDQTVTDWFPMSLPSFTWSFDTGSSTRTITLEVENDFGVGLPPVKLRRTKSFSLYVMDQEYQAPSSSDPLIGTVGFGGESGFEITDPSKQTVTAQPYMVVVRSLVKDETTKELMLMVATARNRDASSVLGTMAIDVFPLPMRPHLKDVQSLSNILAASDSATTTPIKIATNALPTCTVGKSMPMTKLLASGGVAPYFWSAEGLPFGIKLSADGTLSGTILTPGTYSINFSVKDSSSPEFIDETTLKLVAESDLKISTTYLPDPQIGTYYSNQVKATGGMRAYSFKVVSGALPRGLSINSATGVVSGYPVSWGETITTFTAVVEVTDALGSKASRQYTVNLQDAELTIGSPDQSILLAEQEHELRIPITGGKPPYSITQFTLSEASYALVNNAIYVTWTPTKPDQGENLKTFSVAVADSAANTASKPLTVSVTSDSSPIRFGTYGLQKFFSTTDTTTTTVALFGSTNEYTLSGANTLGTFSGVTATALWGSKQINIAGPATAASFNPAEFSADLLRGTEVVAKLYRRYTITTFTGMFNSLRPTGEAAGFMRVTATPIRIGSYARLDLMRPYFNGPVSVRSSNWVYSVRNLSALPAGITLDPTSGNLYGPVQGTLSDPSIIDIYDLQGRPVGAVEVTWNIYGNDIQVVGDSQATMPDAKMYTAYTAKLNLTGAKQVNVELVQGRLPVGLTFAVNTDAGTGLASIDFTGKAEECGLFDLWFKLSDATNANRTGLYHKRLFVDFSSKLTVETDNLPKAFVSTVYTQPLVAMGGTKPYVWSITSGQLPANFTLSANGVISGTTTDATYGSQSVTFAVTDGANNVASKTLTFAIATPNNLSIQTASLPDGTVSVAYPNPSNPGYALAASGGAFPYTWSIQSGQLPAGLTLSASTGLITGTPTQVESKTITFLVTDSQPSPFTATKQLTLAVKSMSSLRITGPDYLPYASINQSYVGTTIVAAGGVEPRTFSILSLVTSAGYSDAAKPSVAINASTGLLTITNNVAVWEGFVTVQVQDSQTPTQKATKTYWLRVNPSQMPVISSTSLPVAYNCLGYSASVAASGGTGAPYTLELHPNSPSSESQLRTYGLSIDKANMKISGTPNVSGIDIPLMLIVRDSAGTPSVAKTLALQLRCSLTTPNTATLKIASTGTSTAYGLDQFVSNEVQPGSSPKAVSFAVSGLPAWASYNATDHTIQANPSQNLSTDVNVQVTVTDAKCTSCTRTFTLTLAVRPPFVITSPAATLAYTPGIPISVPLTATGRTGTLSWSWTGTNQPPSWLTIDSANARLTGTTQNYSGSLTIQVKDSATGDVATKTFTLTVKPNLTLVSGYGDTFLGALARLTVNGIDRIALVADRKNSWTLKMSGLSGSITSINDIQLTLPTFLSATALSFGSGSASWALNFIVPANHGDIPTQFNITAAAGSASVTETFTLCLITQGSYTFKNATETLV